MQTAVDRNGSNSNSNTSITATTTTLVESSSGELLSLDATATRSASTVILAPMTVLEQPSVLRHRLQVGVGVGVGKDAAATAGYQHKNGAKHSLIDVAEYLGSNVERMSLTPSPSPQQSPSKKCQLSTAPAKAAVKLSLSAVVADAAASIKGTTAAAGVGSSDGSSSSTSFHSNSNSSSSSHSAASSVIASPIIARNGNAFPNNSNDNMRDGTIGDATDECSRKALSPRSASFATFEEYYLTTPGGVITEVPMTPLQLSSSSSNSNSPATTTTTATASSASSASSTPITPSTKSPSIEAQLLLWQDMPQYLQFNPYVLKGYRPLQTFKGCLLSLFYWHNETINILTHAIPIVYILATVPGLMPWEQEYRFLSFCHLFGSVAPWCGSFVYHLFMNIEKGENVYYRLLKLDMVGIWVSQSFGALPLVTATTFCFSYKWKWFIIIAYSLLSFWGLYKALTASSPWQRRLCFALPFTMRSFLTLLRTMGLVGGNPIALSHVYLQDGVSILGGAIGAMRIPEKWFPGLVDFYLNSHNIMHVLVVVAVYSMHQATIKDFEWMSATNCNAIMNVTGEAIESTLTSNVEL